MSVTQRTTTPTAVSVPESLLAALGRALGADRVFVLAPGQVPPPARRGRWRRGPYRIAVPIPGGAFRVMWELAEPPTATDRLVARSLAASLADADHDTTLESTPERVLDALVADTEDRVAVTLAAGARTIGASAAALDLGDHRSITWGLGRPALRRAAARAREGIDPVEVGGRTFAARRLSRDDEVVGGLVVEGAEEPVDGLATLLASMLDIPGKDPEPVGASVDLSAVLALLETPALALDADDRLMATNPTAEEICGITDFDLGAPMRDRLHAVGVDDGEQDMDVMIGDRRFDAVRVPLPGGARLLILADRTAEEEKQRAQERVLAAMSHELRTPVAALGSLVEVVSNPRLRENGERLERMVAEGERELHQLSQLVADLLLSARVADDRIRPEATRLELRDAVDEAVRRVSVRHPDGRVVVSGRGEAFVDPALVVHAVRHLVDNAVTHAPGDPVRVRIRRDGASAVVEVTDRGPGIFSGDLPTLFEPFLRLERRATSQHGGAGIGLYLVKAAVEAQGGEVWVRSRLGKGSTFGVRLPAKP